MKPMDGFAACAQLRNLPGGDQIPILFITGLDDLESITRAYDIGVTDFITKPINPPLLLHRVHYSVRSAGVVQALRAGEARLAHAQRLARLGSWEWDLVHGHLTASQEVVRMCNLISAGDRLTYEEFLEIIHPEDRELVDHALQATLREGTPLSLDHRLLSSHSAGPTVHQEAETVYDSNGRAVRMVGTIQDITERKQTEEQIHFLAYYDMLTGLPNRRLFHDRLTQTLAHAERHERVGAVLYMNIDRFKRINDTLGHTAGDQLIQEVSDRIVKCVRKSDSVARHAEGVHQSTVARRGGDEFTILLTELASDNDVARVARRILASLAEPFLIAGQDIVLSASLGISHFPTDGEDVDTLVNNAETAMYDAKEQGRNTYRFYSHAMNASAVERLALEGCLRKAIERNELCLHYQPQVNIRESRIVGVEALLRWNHPERGLIAPAEFIPIAEEAGLIRSIGEWVMRSACTQQQQWQTAGLPPIRVSINLSSLQFQHHDLLETIQSALATAHMGPQYLEIELTENILMKDVESTVKTLRELKTMGVHLAIDDFGTGYSSLSYLKQFPLDTLKIDRSFITGLPANAEDAAIVCAIIALAESLKLRVIAEGVETEAQLAFLRGHGCHEIQGYLFSKPLPPDEMTQLLHSDYLRIESLCTGASTR